VETIYVESEIADHPRSRRILARHPDADVISIERYGEVFNPAQQNFRVQKRRPALILAAKHKSHVLPTPEGYGIGGERNYYFSHMLNCLYDCRYCFLQGMFRSANYLLFVNYEDFAAAIVRHSQTDGKGCYFFSGYDCDSLALEPITEFIDFFVPVFEGLPDAWLELRTKSTQIRRLLARPAQRNCVVAFSLSPPAVVSGLEARTPSLSQRLTAMLKLQQAGWTLGLRFDPIIHFRGWKAAYAKLMEQTFTVLDSDAIHSATLGTLRLPKAFHVRISALYPDEALFSAGLLQDGGNIAYSIERQSALVEHCREHLARYLPETKIFDTR
jgi:spore photoproduct lyase